MQITSDRIRSLAEPLQIGPVRVPNRVFMAPLSGISDRPFREIASRGGAGLVVSEMVAGERLVERNREASMRAERAGEGPHVVQLAGREAWWMGEGARAATDAGADIIDINMGCPSKRVTNGYAGSALMRVPDEALRLVEAVVGATPLPVTVKMRLGWDDDSLNAAQIARRAVDAGVQMIAVHGRTRQQFYKGTARWELVRSVVEAVPVPVVVNGDIVDIDSAREALSQSGAAAVMIGRGAQGQPWLVGQIGAALAGHAVAAGPQGEGLTDFILEHYEAMLSDYGHALGLRVARKHLDWYLDAAGIEPDRDARRALLQAESTGDVKRMIPGVFGEEWRRAA